MNAEDLHAELQMLFERIEQSDDVTRQEVLTLVSAWIDTQAGLAPDPSELPGQFGMIGASPAMQRVFDLVARIVRTDVPVLVLGESGTGKELIAKALHKYGPRKRKPLVSVNCAAIPGTLLEAEIFGHVKGSFTGAHQDRDGYATAADGGTLFLDEIGEIPIELQAKLLRFLQDGEVRPVGSNKARNVDVRIVAATNRALLQRVKDGAFREDLYYRLAVLTLELPPLRERQEDIPALVEFLLQQQAKEGMPTAQASAEAQAVMQAYDWPGNIRQLQNELVRSAAFCHAGMIQPADLSPEVQAGPKS